jgi:formate hydrogenlyase transcriptional activator
MTIFKESPHKKTATMAEKSHRAIHAGTPGKEEIAFKELQAKINEKDILLSLANDITAVRDKNDILRLIHPKIKLLFDTDDIFICFFDAPGETLDPVLRVGGTNRTRHKDYHRIVNSSFPIHDGFIDVILASKDPVVVDLTDFPNPPAYLELAKETGLTETLSISLHHAGEVIGILTLWSEYSDFWTAHHKDLITAIASHISLVVINILASEALRDREEEKTILLSLSNDIAALRNRNDFFQVVIDKLKKIFGIAGFALSKINEDGKTYEAFKLEERHAEQNPAYYEKILGDKYQLSDRVYTEILRSEEPVVFQVEEIAAQTNIPAYVGFWQRFGIRQVLCAPLRVGGKTIGSASFHIIENPGILKKGPLVKSVCAQLAIKMANILAYEDIAKREAEKSILLSLSIDIASLKNRADLFQIVNSRIKAVFSISQFGIVKINEDRLTHSAFMMDLGPSVTDQIDFAAVTNLKYSIHDEAFSQVMASDDPVLLDVDTLSAIANPPAYVRFWKEVGFRQLYSLVLRAGGNTIGAIFFNFDSNPIDDTKVRLLKGICAQLSVAVANILANEKVLQQLSEINKYKQQLEDEKVYLKEEIESSQNYTEIIGDSPEIKKVFRLISQVASSDSTVLLLGETGTGKELIARAIHNASPRKSKLMVKVNCAALPAALIESELFGHERGSFTGAIERRIGKFELANNGTLFLDEIGEMSLELQVKLLRALQEKEIERVGGKTTIKTDARIIAATNRNLEKLMAEGKFRSDLYYRLNIFPIELPSLRERRKDIPTLASYFIGRYAKKAGKKINTINNKVLQELVQYHWPGNIRELEHLIERSVLLTAGDTIKEIHLPRQTGSSVGLAENEDGSIKTMDENEKEYILKVLRVVKGRIGGAGGAAELLGLPTSTLNSRMKRLGIRKEHLG